MNPSVVQPRPAWYLGDLLQRSRAIEIKTFGELSGNVLDEIIQEKLNNPKFIGKDLVQVIFLGLTDPTLRGILRTWNKHKRLLAKIPLDTAATDKKLHEILGKSHV